MPIKIKAADVHFHGRNLQGLSSFMCEVGGSFMTYRTDEPNKRAAARDALEYFRTASSKIITEVTEHGH